MRDFMKRVEYFDQYEKTLEEVRLTFKERIQKLIQESDKRSLLVFWINFSSYGVGMTESVDSWIRRAGQKSEELGYITLGQKLIKHAVHEKGHHLMMIKDLYKLVDFWNAHRFSPFVNAEEFLTRSPENSVIAYQELHEECINSDFPFAQIAIEYEIEKLSAVHGPELVKNACAIFGEDVKSCLSFVTEHMTLDVGHTIYNKRAIAEFVNEYPEKIDMLIKLGSAALKIYADFLDDCHRDYKSFE
jgi:hypothetical protein